MTLVLGHLFPGYPAFDEPCQFLEFDTGFVWGLVANRESSFLIQSGHFTGQIRKFWKGLTRAQTLQDGDQDHGIVDTIAPV